MKPPHQFDPDRLPDDAFEPGRLAHLVPGNRGRLLDPRRTPARVVGIDWRTGQFLVEIEAFEDRGARWELPFEKVGHFQFARGARLLDDTEAGRLETRVRELDRPLRVDCDPAAASRTAAELARRTKEAGAWLAAHSRFFAGHAAPDPNAREGPLSLRQDALAFLSLHDLAWIEESFTAQFVSNPHSGERVKGHSIVIAELGLVPFEGRAVRDDRLFEGAWSKGRRAEHVLWRLAFVRAWLLRAGWAHVSLFRGISSDKPIAPGGQSTFSSASFRFEIAWSCYAGMTPRPFGRLERRRVPAERLFMTHFETDAMNRQFLEAEAVLLGDFEDSLL